MRLLAQSHDKLEASLSQAMCKYLPSKTVYILSNGVCGSIIVRVHLTLYFPSALRAKCFCLHGMITFHNHREGRGLTGLYHSVCLYYNVVLLHYLPLMVLCDLLIYTGNRKNEYDHNYYKKAGKPAFRSVGSQRCCCPPVVRTCRGSRDVRSFTHY